MDGYKIIDFGGITIDANDGYDSTIEGIYNKIDISTKPMVFTGINGVKPFYIGALEKILISADAYGYFGLFGLVGGNMFYITIQDDNRVIIAGQ